VLSALLVNDTILFDADAAWWLQSSGVANFRCCHCSLHSQPAPTLAASQTLVGNPQNMRCRDTHEVLKLVDWHLLVFFAALFVVVEGLSDTGLPDAIYRHLQPMFGAHATAQAWNLTWFSVAGSNIFSNVRFVLVAGKWISHFADPALMWKVLALATTFAGNLTIIDSVANMIVVESAREHLQIGFWDYARFGIPITIVTTAASIGVLLVLH
jgi:Na+/H+ antiporter NhaD/arsenite permease-like protein